MHKVGIDAISFYTSPFYLEMTLLASARGLDEQRFLESLGQEKMAVPSPDEDIITMAANAAERALRHIDKNTIELILFATESGIDQSKAAGIYIHDFLNLPTRCRVLELKQACYSATGAVQLALSFCGMYPDKKVLVIASDIARYGLSTPGEASQGCGAVAMVISATPRIIALDPEFGAVTENVMDFWRPTYRAEALVDGKYSSKLYLKMLDACWTQYHQISKRDFKSHDFICYHTPVSQLVERAHRALSKLNGVTCTVEEAHQAVASALMYGRVIGNTYAASLYINFCSLLDNTSDDLSGKRIGFYSYGSGCVAEFFSGVIQPGYRRTLETQYHQQLLNQRTALSYEEYERFYQFNYPTEGSQCLIPHFKQGAFRLEEINQHKRIYQVVE